MKKFYYIIGIILILGLLNVNNLSAQSNSQIHHDFNQLKNYLTKIWHLVQRFQNVKAKQLMAEVKTHMDLAEEYIYRRDDLPWRERVFKARAEMAKARIKGNQAAKIVLKQPIQKLKAELDDLINRAEIGSSSNPNNEVRYLITQAKKFRRKAHDALGNNQPAKTQEFFRVAFFFANKALDIIHHTESDIDSQINDLRSNLQLLINQTENIASNKKNRPFINLIEEAKKHLVEALHLYESGRKQLALQRLLLIEKLLFRIVDQIDRKSLTEDSRLQNDLFSLKSLLDALETESADVSNNRIKLLLNKAQKLYREAEEAFESGKYKNAQMKISLSQRFASKILKLIKKSDEQSLADIDTQLADAGRLLEMQATPVKESGILSLEKMHSEAIELLNNAQKNYENGNNETAFQLLQISMRLTNKIQRILDKKSYGKDIQNEQLIKKLNRINNLLLKIRNNPELVKKYENIIVQMEQFAQQAQKYLHNQEYELAETYISSLNQQINLYTNKWSKQTE